MNDNRGQRYKAIILITVSVLLILVALAWLFMSWREEQLAWSEQLAARPTSPELVLQAFRDAKYQVKDIQIVEEEGIRGELFGAFEHYIDFKARAGSQRDFTRVRVLQYGSKEYAEGRAAVINRLNENMDGSFGYAFRRDATLMVVDTESERAASQLSGVFLSAAEP